MFAQTRRRTLTAIAVVAAPILAAGTWMATTASAESTQASPKKPAGLGKPVTKLPANRTIMIVAPKTTSGANRILTIHHDTNGVDFARSRPDKKYDLLGGGQVWLGLNPVGPAKDGNYQLVALRDTEGGDARCLSMNSAGQVSLESCEEADGPGGLVIGRDVWNFERKGKKWEIRGNAGYLTAHKRQAGVPTKNRFDAPAKKFTVHASPVRVS